MTTSEISKPSCLVCGDGMIGNLPKCAQCETLYHSECFSYNGGCAVYGCGSHDTAPKKSPQLFPIQDSLGIMIAIASGSPLWDNYLSLSNTFDIMMEGTQHKDEKLNILVMKPEDREDGIQMLKRAGAAIESWKEFYRSRLETALQEDQSFAQLQKSGGDIVSLLNANKKDIIKQTWYFGKDKRECLDSESVPVVNLVDKTFKALEISQPGAASWFGIRLHEDNEFYSRWFPGKLVKIGEERIGSKYVDQDFRWALFPMEFLAGLGKVITGESAETIHQNDVFTNYCTVIGNSLLPKKLKLLYTKSNEV